MKWTITLPYTRTTINSRFVKRQTTSQKTCKDLYGKNLIHTNRKIASVRGRLGKTNKVRASHQNDSETWLENGEKNGENQTVSKKRKSKPTVVSIMNGGKHGYTLINDNYDLEFDEIKKRIDSIAKNGIEKCEISTTMDNVLSIILGGGQGTRLYPLTEKRAKPAVPLGANYRLIDIPVSNCINSDINKIYCLTQFNSASLNRHISRAYNCMGSYYKSGFVEVLAAQQSQDNKTWFQGTADAVRQYQWLFNDSGCDEYLILSGDHLYRMDYKSLIMHHRRTCADITVSAIPVDEDKAGSFGLMKIDINGRVIDFAEKPKGDDLLRMAVDFSTLADSLISNETKPYIASMGVYVFSAKIMKDLLTIYCEDKMDFGGEIIPHATSMGMHVQSYIHDDYWEDIGTIKSFYNANLQCNEDDSPFSFYDVDAPIYTSLRFLPPTKMLGSQVLKSTIGDGCYIHKSKIKNSVIGLRSSISENCTIEDTLLLGADYYENEEECRLKDDCFMPIGVGQGTTIRNAIVDKNARIGARCYITNSKNVEEDLSNEERGWVIKDYIVIICKDATIPDGTVI